MSVRVDPHARVLGLAFVVAGLVGLGCTRHHAVEPQPNPRSGVSPAEIVIGSSAALTGYASFLGTQTLHGSLARVEDVNAHGGVFGRRLKVLSLDDGYEPARAVTNTQKLLVEDDVFALFDYVGTPTSVKIIDMTERAQVPALGFFTGAEPLRNPLRKWMFHVRDPYYSEAEQAVWFFVEQLGVHKIAVIYQEDAFGQAVLAGLQLALKRRGQTTVAIETFARGTMDVERARDALVRSDAEAVAMVGTYGPLAKLVKITHDAGRHPWFHTVSFVGSEAFGNELVATQRIDPAEYHKIIVTQVVPSPFASDFPAVREYRELAHQYFPGDTPNYVALEGFLNATVLVRALEAAGPDLDRARFVSALEGMRDLDIGIGKRLSYSSTSHAGLSAIYFSRLADDGTFQLFSPTEAHP